MNNPSPTKMFDPVGMTADIAKQIAKAILSRQIERLGTTKFGRKLAKLGVLKPDFSVRMELALTETIERYFTTNAGFARHGVINFFCDQGMVGGIGDHVLNGEKIDTDALIERLRDYLDIPKKTPITGWPLGINPRRLLVDIVSELDRTLARNADAGSVWISRKLVEINESISTVLDETVALRKEMPRIFEAAVTSSRTDEHRQFEKRFLEHLSKRYGRLTTPGARELHGIDQQLSIAYISLNVKEQAGKQRRSTDQFLIEAPNLVLQGPAGSGKTTLLNWVTWCCGRDGDDATPWTGGIPFYIPLRTVARLESGPPQVARFVDYSVDSRIWGIPTPVGWVDRVLMDKRGIVLLDGVDELPPSRRSLFWEWVATFAKEYPNNRIVITSRMLPGSSGGSGGLSTNWNPPAEFVAAQLEEMSDSDVSTFVRHWHDSVDLTKIDDLEKGKLIAARDSLPEKLGDPANRRIRELCSTPLLCAIVCVLHWREEGYLPRQKVDLYDRCSDMLIEARDLKREIAPPTGPLAGLTKNDKELVLQRLAF
jgi:hypothetical protein